MSYRYVLAAVLLAATSIPAAAQQTTQPDTSKKASTSGTTTTTSNGAVAEPPAAAAPNPNGPSATPGASINAPASTTAPSTTPPSTGTVTTTPAPASGAASTSPSGMTSTPSGASVSGAASGASTSGMTGQVQPTSGAIKVDVKVAPTLANTVKISADSAFALARASNDAGEISSAELEMKDKALVYNIKMIKGAGASVVHVDAMTGQVVKDKKYGGLKASAENDKQLKKLEDAKEDSTKARKP